MKVKSTFNVFYSVENKFIDVHDDAINPTLELTLCSVSGVTVWSKHPVFNIIQTNHRASWRLVLNS